MHNPHIPYDPTICGSFTLNTWLLGDRLINSYQELNELTIQSPEQPDAPLSEGNTAPQEPKLEGQPQMSVPQPAASSAFDKPTTTSTTDAPPTIATTDAPSNTATTEAPSVAATAAAPSASAAAHSSSSTAAASSSATPAEDTSASSKMDDKEQRESETTEKTTQQMEAGRRGTTAVMHDHGVSKEALKGPQDGHAAQSAAEFEKEGKHGAKDASSEFSSFCINRGS